MCPQHQHVHAPLTASTALGIPQPSIGELLISSSSESIDTEKEKLFNPDQMIKIEGDLFYRNFKTAGEIYQRINEECLELGITENDILKMVDRFADFFCRKTKRPVYFFKLCDENSDQDGHRITKYNPLVYHLIVEKIQTEYREWLKETKSEFANRTPLRYLSKFYKMRYDSLMALISHLGYRITGDLESKDLFFQFRAFNFG